MRLYIVALFKFQKVSTVITPRFLCCFNIEAMKVFRSSHKFSFLIK